MSTQEKRPPINLDELENKGKEAEARQPGGLSYAGEGKVRGRLRGSGDSGRFGGLGTKMLTTALVAVVISIFATFQLAPSKVQYNEAVAAHNALATQVLAIPPTITAVGTRLDNVINSLAGYATKGEITQLATSASVTALDAKMVALSGQIQRFANEADLIDLDSRVTALTARLTVEEAAGKALKDANTALEVRVKALEDKAATVPTSGGGSTVSGEITLVATNLQSSTLFPAGTSSNYYSLVITNSGTALKKVYIRASVMPSTLASSYPLVNVTSSIFSTASSGFTPDGSFTTILTPGIGIGCIRIEGTSNGYLFGGPGTATVLVKLDYVASAPYFWDVTFSPIVVAW